jgi:hypothetical protein
MNGQQFVAELVAEDRSDVHNGRARHAARPGVAGALDTAARGPRLDETRLPNRGPRQRLAVVAWPRGVRCTFPHIGGDARRSERLDGGHYKKAGPSTFVPRFACPIESTSHAIRQTDAGSGRGFYLRRHRCRTDSRARDCAGRPGSSRKPCHGRTRVPTRGTNFHSLRHLGSGSSFRGLVCRPFDQSHATLTASGNHRKPLVIFIHPGGECDEQEYGEPRIKHEERNALCPPTHHVQ